MVKPYLTICLSDGGESEKLANLTLVNPKPCRVLSGVNYFFFGGGGNLHICVLYVHMHIHTHGTTQTCVCNDTKNHTHACSMHIRFLSEC